MMDKAAAMDGPSLMQGLLQRIEHEAGMGRPRVTPEGGPNGELTFLSWMWRVGRGRLAFDPNQCTKEVY
ncbi:hypothetical protein ABIE08_003571 [Kaistia defluvii]|uniref:Uncharacterized protein n=1 Tax=Kaistia defluvii TaxID=410841 RepID=A0ABV2R4Q3_9HYPH